MVDAIGGLSSSSPSFNLGRSNLNPRSSNDSGLAIVPKPLSAQKPSNVQRAPARSQDNGSSADVARLEAQVRSQGQKLQSLAAKVQGIQNSSSGSGPSPGQFTDVLA